MIPDDSKEEMTTRKDSLTTVYKHTHQLTSTTVVRSLSQSWLRKKVFKVQRMDEDSLNEHRRQWIALTIESDVLPS